VSRRTLLEGRAIGILNRLTIAQPAHKTKRSVKQKRASVR
jgi:hypothetical protein